MIVFVHHAEHGYTLRSFLENCPSRLDGGVVTLSYDEFVSWRRLPRGCYIFADLDRLGAGLLNVVSRRWADFEALDGTVRCLNHPDRALSRWPLLQKLEGLGLTPQRVIRADEPLGRLRFPVFLRTTVGHGSAVSPVIYQRKALEARLSRLLHTRGLSRCDIWITEFQDVRNAEGYYEKYSFFRIGKHYFPQDLSTSAVWQCKGQLESFDRADFVERDRQYRETNPHAEIIKPVFEAAGIEYGRVDYGFSDGRLVVFEINMNPKIEFPEQLNPVWHPAVRFVLARYIAALEALGLKRARPYYQVLPSAIGYECVSGENDFRRSSRGLLKQLRALEYEHRLLRLRNAWRRSNRIHWHGEAGAIPGPTLLGGIKRPQRVKPEDFAAPESHPADA